MSLDAFQRVFAAIAGDAALCAAARSGDPAAFEGYDLTPRERRRLTGLAAQPGMRINGLLQRANRFTPLPRLFPLTCALLGPELPRLIQAFWTAWPRTNMQFEEESARFAAFLRSQAADEPLHPALPAVLDLETAILDLRFARSAPTRSLLHHRVRVVAFRHDPQPVLAAAQTGQQPPGDLPAGEHVVLVDGRGDNPQILLLAARPGRVLLALARGEQPDQDGAADAARLAEAGLLASVT